MAPEIKNKYLSMQKVADTLDCTERHIFNLIADGFLTAIKIGSRAVRISEQSLNEFIENRKVNPEDLFEPGTIEENKQPSREQKEVARSKFITR
jgi:excisionase family DNA binding protein